MKESKLFPCYSLPLRNFLTKNDIRYELVGEHCVTKNIFWVYIKDLKLNNILKVWKEIEK